MNGDIKEIVERARKDPNFLHQLVFNPVEAAKGLKLTEEERTALAANTPEQLIGAVLSRAKGCGSTPTCDSTCTATCTVTFTSVKAQGAAA
jgi:hypothetical protein